MRQPQNSPLRLLIIDSIAHLFRDVGDKPQIAALAQRTGILFRISALLRRFADTYNLAIVVTNQVICTKHCHTRTGTVLSTVCTPCTEKSVMPVDCLVRWDLTRHAHSRTTRKRCSQGCSDTRCRQPAPLCIITLFHAEALTVEQQLISCPVSIPSLHGISVCRAGLSKFA